MNSKKCYIIAEAGLNHNGSMDLAKNLIDTAEAAKVDAVKFQKRNVDTLATNDVLDAEDIRFPSLGSTYREIRESLEFSKEEYIELKSYSESKGLDFICTAFDVQSVDFLEEIGLECYKLASHSITNLPLLEYVASKKKKIIFSTGMCTLDEVDQAVEMLKQNDNKLMLLHCVSSYPQSPEESNLSLMEVYRERYGLPVGYSGHELGYTVTLAAAAAGAVSVERHFTLDHSLEGFDHKLSIEPQELTAMVEEIRIIEKCFGSGTKEISEIEQITRNKYHVSMVTTREIKQGEIITSDMITYKNPGTGIQPKDESKIIGKKSTQNVPADKLVDYSMTVSILKDIEPSTKDRPESTKLENTEIAAICPVLKEFFPEQMDLLVKDLREASFVNNIYVVSELEEVNRYCKENGLTFIQRPDTLMPSESTIEDVLQYSLEAIEKTGYSPELILYTNYAFKKRPSSLFLNLINKVIHEDMDTVFPAEENFNNLWKKDDSGQIVMIGDWLPHERREPMHLAVNGLGTVTKSCFIRKRRLIGDHVGLLVITEHAEK